MSCRAYAVMSNQNSLTAKTLNFRKTTMKKIIFTLAAAALLTLGSCKTGTSVSGTYATAPAANVCLSINPMNTVDIKAWGTGSTRAEAVQNAIRSALVDVIFKGYTSGQGVAKSGVLRPLLNEVNAQERYSYYFTPFFADKGEYLAFASEKNGAENARYKANSHGNQSIAIIVTVDRNALRNRLIQDGILQP